MQKFKFLFICSFLIVGNIFAQQKEVKIPQQMMYKAYIMNSQTLWERSLSQLETSYQDCPSSALLLQMAYAEYGLAGYYISGDKKKEGIATVEEGIKYAKQLLEDEVYAADGHALLAGLYGLHIAFSPMKGMSLGPKSDQHLAKAFSLSPDHAFAHLQKGTSLYNTPKIFGGSAKKSITSFQQAIAQYEIANEDYNWHLLAAKAWLGQAFHYLNDYDQAEATYQSALAIEPDFSWIKSGLLPALESDK